MGKAAASSHSDLWSIRPSIPREHGSWFIVFGPLLLGLVSGAPPGWLDAALLIVASTGFFFSQDALRPLLRRRRNASLGWFGVCVVVTVLAGAPLVWRHPPLAVVGALGLALAAPQVAMMRRRGKRRFERTRLGQLLGVPLLTLTAVAGWVVAHGSLDGGAWALWLAVTAYFASGVTFVHLYFDAARVQPYGDEELVAKGPAEPALTWGDRLAVGRVHLLLHGALVVGVGAAAALLGGLEAWLLWAAFLPAIVRAVIGWARLSRALPALIALGLGEAAYASVFLGCGVALLRLGVLG